MIGEAELNDSFRNNDMKAEKQLADFMDRCFYSKLYDLQGNKVKFERKTERQSQLNGIDVEIIAGGRRFLIDEKASFYYSNAMIPTFAFEIDSIQKGHMEPVEGWFLNNSLATEYYMLIWPNIKCEKKGKQWVRKDIGNLSSFDFTIVEAMLVEKHELLIEVEKRGLNRDYLITYAKKLRNNMKSSNDTFSEEVADDIKIMYSGQLAEKPINAVVRKEVIKKVAKATYLISEDGYAKI